jgi:hypothetical protein
MMKRTFGIVLIVSSFLIIPNGCWAKDILFAKASRNYGSPGREGETYRRELETRMFSHDTWRQRLYYHSSEPNVDETIEVYSKPDGSRWLSHRTASPSFTEIIYARIVEGQKFDLEQRLAAVRVTSHDVILPSDVVSELALLWRAMLPGLAQPPLSQDLYTHVPIFIGFTREGGPVKTGSICRAAYNTPIYRMFVDVIADLRDVSDRAASATDPVLRRLPDKMRRLRARL